jgi:hypothetical protein
MTWPCPQNLHLLFRPLPGISSLRWALLEAELKEGNLIQETCMECSQEKEIRKVAIERG